MREGDRVRLREPGTWLHGPDDLTTGTVRGFAKIFWPQDVENPDAPDVLVEWDSKELEAAYYPPEHLVVLSRYRR